MMSLTFYTNSNEIRNIEISEDSYRKLAEAGMENIADFIDRKILIEDEEYEINAAELIDEVRVKFRVFIENERQQELELLFKSIDNSPTVKEIREKFEYVKHLTELYVEFRCRDNVYFSYD